MKVFFTAIMIALSYNMIAQTEYNYEYVSKGHDAFYNCFHKSVMIDNTLQVLDYSTKNVITMYIYDTKNTFSCAEFSPVWISEYMIEKGWVIFNIPMLNRIIRIKASPDITSAKLEKFMKLFKEDKLIYDM